MLQLDPNGLVHWVGAPTGLRKHDVHTTRGAGPRSISAKGVAMSTVRKKCLPFLAAVVALGILLPTQSTLAQSSPAQSSVLPTGGGQGSSTRASLSVNLLKNGTLKVYKKFPHGMCTTHAEVVNPKLLAFIRG